MISGFYWRQVGNHHYELVHSATNAIWAETRLVTDHHWCWWLLRHTLAGETRSQRHAKERVEEQVRRIVF